MLFALKSPAIVYSLTAIRYGNTIDGNLEYVKHCTIKYRYIKYKKIKSYPIKSHSPSEQG